MINALMRTWDNLLGRGEAAVTVPPLDGALCPNRMLDEASSRFPLPHVDCLSELGGQLVASAGRSVYKLDDANAWQEISTHESDIACITAINADGLAVALVTGEIHVLGGAFDGARYRVSPDVRCITAMAVSGPDLYITNGSAQHSPENWQLDLMERNASGSLWRIELAGGRAIRIVGDLAYPAGIATVEDDLVYSEAWKHRLVRIGRSGPAKSEVLYAELPGYPGRIAVAGDGYWLAAFAPRSQLVEFVLREAAYRKRMVADVPRDFWIAPKLRSGGSFYEPMQGGGVKQLGLLKPWAPTMSAGLCVKLDTHFQPRLSLQSRADGATHGITDIAEHRGRIYAAARGDGVVVSIGLDELGDIE